MVSAAPCADPTRPHIDIDQELGARQVVRHLVGLGHRQIAHFAGPEAEFHAQRRRAGWQRELELHGLAAPPVLQGTWAPGSGYELAKRLLAGPRPLPTAVFAANDHVAMGALRAFGEAGLQLPGDISVAGFDDIPGVDQLRPPLTTVRQDLYDLGCAAFDLLRQVIEERQPASDLALVPELVVRASTGPGLDR
jgi:DNA-binding LacI/PurR family transcriptional regulator